jgi:hypothetical protein
MAAGTYYASRELLQSKVASRSHQRKGRASSTNPEIRPSEAREQRMACQQLNIESRRASAQEYKTSGTSLDSGNKSSAFGRKRSVLVLPESYCNYKYLRNSSSVCSVAAHTNTKLQLTFTVDIYQF